MLLLYDVITELYQRHIPTQCHCKPKSHRAPFMTLVCDLVLCLYFDVASCGKLPVNNSKTVANVVATSESLVVTSNETLENKEKLLKEIDKGKVKGK